MNLVEQARKRLEEKQNLAKRYSERCELITQLSKECKNKYKNKLADLRANSGIDEKLNLIKSLTEEVEKKEKEVNKLAEIYSKKLSKKMGIEELREEVKDMYDKIHSEQTALTFRFKDLRKELFELSGRKPKIHVYVQDLIWYANSAILNMKIKGCEINLETILSDLKDCCGKEHCLGEWLDVKNLSNLTLSIKDCTLLNFFEENTKDKTQELVKQALINLSNKQELNIKNNKNID